MADELSPPSPRASGAGATPGAAAAPAPENPAPAAEPGDLKSQLRTVAETGNQSRLSPSEEDKATRLMRECILEGSEGVVAALEAMPRLPWILGVRAVESAWPTLAEGPRAQVLEGLAAMQTDNGFRLRLSVARGLAKTDPAAAMQIGINACNAMWNRETGSLSPERSKLIGNVFIGRGKPWVLQFPLADSADPAADSVAASVVFSAFNVNNPPITQLSILRYAAGRLGRMHENVLAMVARGVGRWNARWQKSLREEVPDLPETILAALKPGREAEAAPEPAAGAAEEEPEAPLPPELEEKFRLAAESGDPEMVETATREINAWREAQRLARMDAIDEEADEEADDEEAEEDDEAQPDRPRDPRGRRGRRGREQRERPAYISREQEARGSGGSGYDAIIKQLDSFVSSLRSELATAQSRLRRAEDESRKSRADRPLLSPEEANLSPDELKRLVIQLENRISDLQARVEELTADSETRALARDAGPADAVSQLRMLLALKLQDDYADFVTLEQESPDAVVQQHYRDLIRHVFKVLQDEQVPLRVPEEPAQPPPPVLPATS
jgi:hypothetical protein